MHRITYLYIRFAAIASAAAPSFWHGRADSDTGAGGVAGVDELRGGEVVPGAYGQVLVGQDVGAADVGVLRALDKDLLPPVIG
jgi:O-acetyl-ADP-ribose deacetylase (regulator of RNase III)